MGGRCEPGAWQGDVPHLAPRNSMDSAHFPFFYLSVHCRQRNCCEKSDRLFPLATGLVRISLLGGDGELMGRAWWISLYTGQGQRFAAS